MKSFKSTAWLLPQPVLIIGTYDKEGKPNAMNAAIKTSYEKETILNIMHWPHADSMRTAEQK